MLRFTKDDNGIMGLTLSQIGLMIATGILIAAVFSLVFQNEWQKEAELQNIATSFSTMIEGMDTRFFENTADFHFPDKGYYYNVSISTEYITVSTKGNLGSDISIKECFLVKPWPKSKGSIWMNGTTLHDYLKDNFGNSGNISDPIQNVDDVREYLYTEWENVTKSLALEPLYISTDKTTYIEKICIYYEDGEKQDIVVTYQ